MQSHERYAGEADMAKTAREHAESDEAYEAFDQAWAASFTASRHALLVLRWQRAAAADRQAAAQPAATAYAMNLPHFLRGSVNDPVIMAAELSKRADRSLQIAENHRKAAEEWGEKGAGLMAKGQAATPAPKPADAPPEEAPAA